MGFVGIFIVAPLLIMLFDRREPITITSGRIEPQQAKAGDIVSVIWTAIEHRNCEGELRRTIVDHCGKINEFQPEATVYHDAMSADAKSFSRELRLPLGLCPGPATYFARVQRWCNPIQGAIWPISFRSPPINFEVIK